MRQTNKVAYTLTTQITSLTSVHHFIDTSFYIDHIFVNKIS